MRYPDSAASIYLMNGKLLAQLAWIALRDADASVPDPYALPRVNPTEDQTREFRRLRAISQACGYKAAELGFVDQGCDACFDDNSTEPSSI